MSEHIKVTVHGIKVYHIAALISHMLTTFGEKHKVEVVDGFTHQNITTNIGDVTVNAPSVDSDTLRNTLEKVRSRYGLDHIHGEPIEHEVMRVEINEPRYVESGPIEMSLTPQAKALLTPKE